MPLFINQEKIDNALIIQEMERMRPEYEKAFQSMDQTEREHQLLEWARENIVEQVLIRQVAKKDKRPISEEIITDTLRNMHPDLRNKSDSQKDVNTIREDVSETRLQIEEQLRIERMIAEINETVHAPSEAEIRASYNRHPDPSITSLPFESVKSRISDQIIDERRNVNLEMYVDALKAESDIQFKMDEQLELTIARNLFRNQHYAKPLNSLLIKPSGPDCNMACTYCFYREKTEMFNAAPIRRMNDETLDTMIRQAMVQAGDAIHFAWQGGEPTLMGLDFYECAVACQRRYGHNQRVGNSLQTNGLLLDKTWSQFLRDHQFLVGLSIDGPEHVHDHYRRLQGGQPSWASIMKNGQMLLEDGVAVNAITVVNDYSVQFAEEIYNFHKAAGFSFMQFIPCVEYDENRSSRVAPFSVDAERYGDFLCTLFDLWRADFIGNQPSTSIRFFDSVFYTYAGYVPPECTLMETCGDYLVVEHNGDVYACDFYVEPQWKLGNIHTDQMIDLLNAPKQQEFGQRKSELDKTCLECEWLTYCRGGCPKERKGHPHVKNISCLCAAYHTFFSHAHEDLTDLATAWKTRQSERDSAIQSTKPGRNDLCPCGSGKKFKKCCGKE